MTDFLDRVESIQTQHALLSLFFAYNSIDYVFFHVQENQNIGFDCVSKYVLSAHFEIMRHFTSYIAIIRISCNPPLLIIPYVPLV